MRTQRLPNYSTNLQLCIHQFLHSHSKSVNQLGSKIIKFIIITSVRCNNFKNKQLISSRIGTPRANDYKNEPLKKFDGV